MFCLQSLSSSNNRSCANSWNPIISISRIFIRLSSRSNINLTPTKVTKIIGSSKCSTPPRTCTLTCRREIISYTTKSCLSRCKCDCRNTSNFCSNSSKCSRSYPSKSTCYVIGNSIYLIDVINKVCSNTNRLTCNI